MKGYLVILEYNTKVEYFLSNSTSVDEGSYFRVLEENKLINFNDENLKTGTYLCSFKTEKTQLRLVVMR